MKKNKRSGKFPRWLWWSLGGALAAAFLCVPGFYFFNFHGRVVGTQEHWGQFGDFIGGTLNPILGLATVIGVLKTYQLQQRQLKLQAKAMKETAELNALSAALEATNVMINNPKQRGLRDPLDHMTALDRREAIIRAIFAKLDMHPRMYIPDYDRIVKEGEDEEARKKSPAD